MKIVVVSACLCGINCRWHGKKARVSKIVQTLQAEGVTVVPVCPEQLGGLSTPRPPVRSIKCRQYITDPETRKEIGKEVSDNFNQGAQVTETIMRIVGAKEAYLFKLSPSCAFGGVTGKHLRAAGFTVIPTY